jgi:hypothetical protein
VDWNFEPQSTTTPNNPTTITPYVSSDTLCDSNLKIRRIAKNPESFANKYPIETFKMGDADIKASQWRLVEVGRVVLVQGGPSDGRLATIVEIIDHKRVRLRRKEMEE